MLDQLDQRAKTLLKLLIERYIADGQPVGSRTLSKQGGLDLSPASIRNVMSDLEERGYIASPHTSAGRVPTPRAYRLFVDTMLTSGPLDQIYEEQLTVQLQDKPQSLTSQQLMSSAAQLLSSLSHFAGVVLTPRRSQTFQQIDFLRLSEKRLLLVIVTPEGSVQNRILLTQRDYSASELIEAANYINAHYANLDFEEVLSRLQLELETLRSDMSILMQKAMQASSDAASEAAENVVIAGERKLLDVNDLASNRDRLRKVFEIFEKKTDLLQLLNISNRAQGIQIFIGGESDLVPMEEMSVITAPYKADGKIVGTLGVIGPTRMAYERVIPIVDITAKLLSSALSQH